MIEGYITRTGSTEDMQSSVGRLFTASWTTFGWYGIYLIGADRPLLEKAWLATKGEDGGSHLLIETARVLNLGWKAPIRFSPTADIEVFSKPGQPFVCLATPWALGNLYRYFLSQPADPRGIAQQLFDAEYPGVRWTPIIETWGDESVSDESPVEPLLYVPPGEDLPELVEYMTDITKGECHVETLYR